MSASVQHGLLRLEHLLVGWHLVGGFEVLQHLSDLLDALGLVLLLSLHLRLHLRLQLRTGNV